MTGYYLTFNNGTDFELYGNLKLGSKKLKQQDWFMLEPQTLSFDLLYFSNANGTQETLSNTIIDTIFMLREPVNGLIPWYIVRMYFDSTLLFTGIVDLTQSKYSEISKKATVTCYDYLKLLSVLKDDDKSIVDNRYSYSDYLVLLQSALDELAITDIDVHSSGGIPNGQLTDAISISLFQKIQAFEGYPEQTLEHGFIFNTEAGTKYFGCLFFLFINIRPGQSEEGEFGFISESILISFDGLNYSRLISNTGFDIYEYDDNPQNDLEIVDQRIGIYIKYMREMREYLSFNQTDLVLAPDVLTVSGLIYNYLANSYGGLDSTISITGSMFSYFHTIGKYLKDGLNDENTTSIIDVLKMYLMANNQICYANGAGLQITGYGEYQTTHVIADDDILEISNNYIEKKKIERIPGINADTEYWLRALNLYYSDNIGSVLKTVDILLSGNETIKAGDEITNATYGLDLFIIELKHEIGDMTITVTGV